MQFVIQNGQVVLGFSDSADFSQWPIVIDQGQSSIVEGIKDYSIVSVPSIALGTDITTLSYNGVTVIVTPLTTQKKQDQIAALQAQIDAMESYVRENRGSREMAIQLCLEFMTQSGYSNEADLYARNPYYKRLKDQNTAIMALRAEMAALS